jgi:RNA polymerase sigma-70 factor (ECF subfamily)
MHDDQLIAGALSGRQEDFGALVERYQKMLYAFAYRQLDDPDGANDVVQTTFVRAYTNLHKFRRESSFKTWLHQIALNECRSRFRRQQRRAEVPLDAISETALPAAGFDPSIRAEKSSLQRHIARLPERQRAVLAMRVFSDLPFKEIALAQGISENSAKVSYHHAVQRLKKWMS